jgi:hypothetical protein
LTAADSSVKYQKTQRRFAPIGGHFEPESVPVWPESTVLEKSGRIHQNAMMRSI